MAWIYLAIVAWCVLVLAYGLWRAWHVGFAWTSVTTSSAHGLTVGDIVLVGYDVGLITSVSSTSFTYRKRVT